MKYSFLLKAKIIFILYLTPFLYSMDINIILRAKEGEETTEETNEPDKEINYAKAIIYKEKKDIVNYTTFLIASAKKNNPEALYELGHECFLKAQEYATIKIKDYENYDKLKAIIEFTWGKFHQKNNDLDKAVIHFESAVKAGHIESRKFLILILLDKAEYYLQKAAENDHNMAKNELELLPIIKAVIIEELSKFEVMFS